MTIVDLLKAAKGVWAGWNPGASDAWSKPAIFYVTGRPQTDDEWRFAERAWEYVVRATDGDPWIRPDWDTAISIATRDADAAS